MNMEHFISTVFWIATLSGCLQAAPLFSDSRIPNMRTDVTCLNDSTFYAPDNIKDECITAALECVLSEFNVTVRDECTDPKQYIDQEIDYLDQIIQHRPEAGHDVKSSKCQCERWSQTPFDEFLNKVQSLIELSNTASKS